MWWFRCQIALFLPIFLLWSNFTNFFCKFFFRVKVISWIFFANFRALWPGGCWWRYCRRWHDERWWLPLSRSSCPWKRWGYRCWGPHKRFAMTDRRISRRKKICKQICHMRFDGKKKNILLILFPPNSVYTNTCTNKGEHHN